MGENRHWKEGLYQQVVCNAPQHIQEEFGDIIRLIHSLSTSLCLNGIFEAEFLYDGFHSYFLELNLLPGLYGIDDQGLMPVLEQVVIPYLQHFGISATQKTDFQFGPSGQFYPPSGSSAPWYKAHYCDVDCKSLGSHGDDSSLAELGENTVTDDVS